MTRQHNTTQRVYLYCAIQDNVYGIYIIYIETMVWIPRLLRPDNTPTTALPLQVIIPWLSYPGLAWPVYLGVPLL